MSGSATLVTWYGVNSASVDDQEPAKVVLEINPAYGFAVLQYQQNPDPNVIEIFPTLEDLARLGRVAQAILDGKEPNARNYDERMERKVVDGA